MNSVNINLTCPASWVKHPSGNPRVPKEWFNPVVNKYIPELANRLAQISADAVLNAVG
jgi:hypothetical protein